MASNPGSFDDAGAAAADFIILVNQNAVGTDTIDLASANQGSIDSYTLTDGQGLLGFRNGDSIDLAEFGATGGAPTNLLVTGVDNDTIITNPGAGTGSPNLTTTASGQNVINLANGSTSWIGGVSITATANSDNGVYGDDITSVEISGSSINGRLYGVSAPLASSGTASSSAPSRSMARRFQAG